jgi:hypothetical protein
MSYAGEKRLHAAKLAELNQELNSFIRGNQQFDVGASDQAQQDVQGEEVYDSNDPATRRKMVLQDGQWIPAPVVTERPLFDAKGNRLVLSADRKTLIPENVVAGKGEIVQNPGELDYGGVKGVINKVSNAVRPIARKFIQSTPVAGLAAQLYELMQENKGSSENIISRPLSDITKGIKKAVAGIGNEGAVSTEDKLYSFLSEKYPELAKKRPANALSNVSDPKSLRRFAGVGEIKSPYGRFSVSEDGTLRRL